MSEPEAPRTTPPMEYETWLYASLYPSTVCVGAGLNAVNRAVALALYKGFKTITVLGADCCARTGDYGMPPEDTSPRGSAEYQQWLAEQQMYPAGNIPALAATSVLETYGAEAALMEGVIDGRRWVTRPDMIVSAINLIQLKRDHGARLELVGDTLPNALLGKSEEFMKSLPSLGENSAVVNLWPRGTPDAEPTETPTVVLHLTNPNKPNYETHVRTNAQYRHLVITGFGECRDKRVVICGAGPSLAEDIGLITTRKPDELWATNRALTWLLQNGYHPTHALWVDPGNAWETEWADPPDVTYYISTSVQPGLLEHLRAHRRKFRLFHNWIGISAPEGWTPPVRDAHPVAEPVVAS